MINLLPADIQKSHRAARLNLKLRSYIGILSFTLLGIAGIYGGGYYLTLQERSAAEALLQQHKQETAQYQKLRDEAQTFADNLKIAKTILSKETHYSDLIVQIAQTLPQSAILTSLSLDASTFQSKPLALSGRVKTETDALTLKNALEASPLFENVSLTSVAITDTDGETNPLLREYPVNVSLSAKVSGQSTTGDVR